MIDSLLSLSITILLTPFIAFWFVQIFVQRFFQSLLQSKRSSSPLSETQVSVPSISITTTPSPSPSKSQTTFHSVRPSRKVLVFRKFLKLSKPEQQKLLNILPPEMLSQSSRRRFSSSSLSSEEGDWSELGYSEFTNSFPAPTQKKKDDELDPRVSLFLKSLDELQPSSDEEDLSDSEDPENKIEYKLVFSKTNLEDLRNLKSAIKSSKREASPSPTTPSSSSSYYPSPINGYPSYGFLSSASDLERIPSPSSSALSYSPSSIYNKPRSSSVSSTSPPTTISSLQDTETDEDGLSLATAKKVTWGGTESRSYFPNSGKKGKTTSSPIIAKGELPGFARRGLVPGKKGQKGKRERKFGGIEEIEEVDWEEEEEDNDEGGLGMRMGEMKLSDSTSHRPDPTFYSRFLSHSSTPVIQEESVSDEESDPELVEEVVQEEWEADDGNVKRKAEVSKRERGRSKKVGKGKSGGGRLR